MTEARHAAVAWAAMRAVFEGAAPGCALLADISGRKAETIARRAKAENWSIVDGLANGLPGGPSRAERVARLAGLLIGEIETIQSEGQGGGYDKARIDTVAALTRALEKLGELGGTEVDMQQEQKKNDAEKASILRRIDERIIELARYFADEIVAGRGDAGRGAEG